MRLKKRNEFFVATTILCASALHRNLRHRLQVKHVVKARFAKDYDIIVSYLTL